MVSSEYFTAFRAKLQRLDPKLIIFTKFKQLDFIEKRNHQSLNDIKIELIKAKYLKFVQKELVLQQGILETRFQCYFLYPDGKGKKFVITFNGIIRIITVFPLGRLSMKKVLKKFIIFEDLKKNRRLK